MCDRCHERECQECQNWTDDGGSLICEHCAGTCYQCPCRRRVLIEPNDSLPAHRLVNALAAAIAAHHDLSAAVATTCEHHSVRDVAQLLGVTHSTAHRWRTAIPGTEALTAALAAAVRCRS